MTLEELIKKLQSAGLTYIVFNLAEDNSIQANSATLSGSGKTAAEAIADLFAKLTTTIDGEIETLKAQIEALEAKKVGLQ